MSAWESEGRGFGGEERGSLRGCTFPLIRYELCPFIPVYFGREGKK
jgi:hypothetical protein